MKIYEFLGIDHLLMDIPIPQNAILENVDAGSYGEAVAAFRNIDYISLRVSLNRDEHYLQVMEIGMNTPRDIDVIAKIIQKTIKELDEEAENYRKVNHAAEVEKIEAQKKAIEKYLPQMMSDAEIESVIAGLEDKSVPTVMRHFKANYGATCDMKRVSEILRTKFN